MEEFLQQERHAKINGWILLKDYGCGIVLAKGTKRIWQFRNGWQVADLLPTGLTRGDYVYKSYFNHRPEKTLAEAIDNNS